MEKEKTKKISKRAAALLSVIMLLTMVIPQSAFAIDSGDIPVYLTTEETSALTVADVVISESLNMVSDGNTGAFGAGTITVANNRTVGSVSVDKIKYTDNATITGWTIVKDSLISPGMAINSRKYSLLVKTGTTTSDLSSEVTVTKGTLLAEPSDNLELEFSGNLSAVTSDWTKVPIGRIVLTLSLYQDDEVFQISEKSGNNISVITDQGTLYAAGNDEVNINVTNLGAGTISKVKVINLETSAEVPTSTLINGSKYNFTMPNAPVQVEASRS